MNIQSVIILVSLITLLLFVLFITVGHIRQEFNWKPLYMKRQSVWEYTGFDINIKTGQTSYIGLDSINYRYYNGDAKDQIILDKVKKGKWYVGGLTS